MERAYYESRAKQIYLKGSATVKEVEWLASRLEQADKFDKIKDSLYPSTRKLLSDEVKE